MMHIPLPARLMAGLGAARSSRAHAVARPRALLPGHRPPGQQPALGRPRLPRWPAPARRPAARARRQVASRPGAAPRRSPLGLTDGFGGNSWRLVTTASAKDEIAKCPSVTELHLRRRPGQHPEGHLRHPGPGRQGRQRAGRLPGRRQRDAAGAAQRARRPASKTVPYRVDPGGTDGKDYDVWVGADFATDGKNWANWIVKNLPDGGNVLFLSGPTGNSQGIDEVKGLHAVLDPTGKYTFIGEQPFEADELGPGQDPAGPHRGDREEPEDRRHRLRLRPLAGRRPARRSRRAAGRSRRSRRPTATCCPASTRTTRPRTRTSSCSRSRPATTTPASPSTGRSPSRPVARPPDAQAVRGTGVRGLGQRPAAPGDVRARTCLVTSTCPPQMPGADQAKLLK